MDVAVTELRAHLSTWLERARGGEEIIVTDRGIPVVRLVGVDSSVRLDELVREGAIARPQTDERPRASGRVRPRTARSLADRVSADRG